MLNCVITFYLLVRKKCWIFKKIIFSFFQAFNFLPHPQTLWFYSPPRGGGILNFIHAWENKAGDTAPKWLTVPQELKCEYGLNWGLRGLILDLVWPILDLRVNHSHISDIEFVLDWREILTDGTVDKVRKRRSFWMCHVIWFLGKEINNDSNNFLKRIEWISNLDFIFIWLCQSQSNVHSNGHVLLF